MKSSYLKATSLVVVLGASAAAWYLGRQPAASPAPVLVDKAEKARQTEAERLKKEGVAAPARKGSRLPFEELQANQQARPTLRTSLLDLDLSRPPSEDELIKAGQLGDALSPTRSADVSKIQDPAARAKQEKDNWAFGKAIQTWNEHRYDEAVLLFTQHMQENPDSPWAAESKLHIGCAAQYRGQYDVCYEQFGFILDNQPKGSDMYQKALLRSANIQTMQGRFKEAAATYQEALRTEQSSSRKTYASAWLPILAQYVKQQTAMRDCVQKSLKEVCTILGLPEEAKKMEGVRAPREDGFTAAQVLELCRECDLDAKAVRIAGKQTEAMEFPFLAHYKDQHFVAVFAAIDDTLWVYDSRVGFQREISMSSFKAQWSGFAVALNGMNTGTAHHKVEVASVSGSELDEVIGGCCGVMPSPSKMGGPCEDCDDNKNAPAIDQPDVSGPGLPKINGAGSPPTDNSPSTRQSPSWWVNPVSFNMVVRDTPMWWDSPFGLDVNFTFTFNSLDTLNAIRPVGSKWVLNYGGYAMEDPSGKVIIVADNGNQWSFLPKTGGGYTAPNDFNSTLTKTGTYEFKLTNIITGSITRYGRPSGVSTSASLFLSTTDRWNVSVTSTYNSYGALTNITHSEGGTWDLFYNLDGLLERIDDPFGRSAYFAYDAAGTLREIEDMGGLRYSFRYSNGNQGYLTHLGAGSVPGGGGAINATPADQMLMTEIVFAPQELPYMDQPNRTWYPLIYRFESHPPENDVNGMWGAYQISISEPYGGTKIVSYDGLDRGAYKTAAQVAAGSSGTTYTYAMANGEGHISVMSFPTGGSASFTDHNSAGIPLTVERRDGIIFSNTVNSLERILEITDSQNRVVEYTYDTNDIDVTKITDPDGNIIIETVYNIERLPQKILLRNGSSVNMTYNANGQPITKQLKDNTNTIVQTVTYTYNVNNSIESIDIDGRTVTSYTYTSIGLVESITNDDGQTIAYSYDDLNRAVNITRNGSISETLSYAPISGMIEWTAARDGQRTVYFHDRRGYPTAVNYPGQRLTYISYDNDGNVVFLKDASGNETKWRYDIEGRLLEKKIGNHASESYSWNVKGQLTQVTSPRGLQTIFSYNDLGKISEISYQTSSEPVAFPTEFITYDNLGRISSRTDGEGATTYDFDTSGRLSSINGPYSNDTVSYDYDSLSRIIELNTPGGVSQSFTYDSDERLSSWTDAFGSGAITYDGRTQRVLQVEQASGILQAELGYTTAGEMFKQTSIKNTSGGNTLSQFDYSWDHLQNVSTWTRKLGVTSDRETKWNLKHDLSHQIVGATLSKVSDGSTLSELHWSHDLSGNIKSTFNRTQNLLKEYEYGSGNQLGLKREYNSDQKPWIRGNLSEPANIKIEGRPLPVNGDNSFEGPSPARTASISAKDASGNSTDEMWQLNNGSGSSADLTFTFTHDIEGNLLSDGSSQFEWDLRNRLKAIVTGSHRTEYSYDGLNRRVKSVEFEGGLSISERRYIYNGNGLLEERDFDNATVLRRFYPTGHVDVADGGKRYIYTTDHLGSVREVLLLDGVSGSPTTATLVARYDYDLWGKREILDGGAAAEDFVLHGYTGHLYHKWSGVSLAAHRAYSSSVGRWVSRDPLYEKGGVNLYSYVLNSPVMMADPDGRLGFTIGAGAILGGAFGAITGGWTGGWTGALAGAVGGAVSGGLMGAGVNPYAAGAMGAAAGAMTGSLLNGDPWKTTFAKGVVAIPGGALFGGLAEKFPLPEKVTECLVGSAAAAVGAASDMAVDAAVAAYNKAKDVVEDQYKQMEKPFLDQQY